jgi:uncharacterized membrane protein YgcG
MQRPGIIRCLLLVLSSLCCGLTSAEERILSFHSDISIAEDASMEVTERIRVRADGDAIKRGIYRDFPTDYTDRYGNAYRVDFDLLAVTRDGEPEPWHSERRSNGVRIYIGSQDVRLSPGQYTYRLTYRTDRQLGFFEDADELYWNVTGNGWAFPIDQASAVVKLPQPVPIQQLSGTAYTGSAGSTLQNYVMSLSEGEFRFKTNRALGPRQGLTIVARWPKGIVTAPGRWQRLGYLLKDNRGLLLALVALLGSAVYLHLAWRRYGRDPEPGVIFPRYQPPAGYSPASARYINRMGYDAKVFSAAVINLAVKGHLTIINDDGDYTLQRQTSTEPLAPGESALLSMLFTGGPVVELDNKNHQVVGSAREAHKRALVSDYRNIYFRLNTARIAPSALGTIATAVIIGLSGAFTPLAIAALLANIVLHAIYIYLLRAPTAQGRLLMDQLMGFKLYLEVAEKDDLNRLQAPQKTPELFEKYLPFAVALGVEQAWAEQFSDVFSRLGEQRNGAYRPAWYQGSFNSARLGGFASNLSGSFSSAISSAATPPGSSSGGSGGSSGGGGGGGGGGGW